MKHHDIQQDTAPLWLKISLIGFVVFFFGTVLFLGLKGSGTVPTLEVINPTENIKGSATAPVTIIEYSDFQCPACKYYHKMLNDSWSEIEDSTRLVYRNFPLTDNHPWAKPAAMYAEAAAKQGKFWEMHDLLFFGQDSWVKDSDTKGRLRQYAESLGVNMEQFDKDIVSSEVKNKVENDMKSGMNVNITGTPTFFVNGQKIENPRTPEEFVKIIKDAASQKK